MSRSSTSIGVGTFALVAAGIAVAHFSGGGGGQATSASVQAAPKMTYQAPNQVVADEENPYLGSCTAYLPLQDAKLPADPNRADAYEVLEKFFNERHEKIEPKELSGMHYAVALVPDPRHTHLSLLFDRSIEAIQQAAQDEGYTYNSSWMPWQLDKREYGSRAEQIAEERARQAREACPGILLFRKSFDTVRRSGAGGGGGATDAPFTDGLVVFVVGEQPTGGLNISQWENALQWLRGNADPADANVATLHVLGPTFSGSLPSLEQRLVHLFKPSPSKANQAGSSAPFTGAYVFSGTVGSCSSVKWFNESIHQRDKLPVVFGAFQENDELQIHRFLEYLAAESNDRRILRDIAILSEDETAYGYSGPNAPDGSDAKAGQTAPAQISAGDKCDYPYPYDLRPVRLFYPRDISAVRTAYQKQAVFSRQNASTAESGHAPQVVLNPDEGNEGSEQSDTVASFSREQSALAEEADLYGLVSFLRAHHTRYILMRSTNPLDYLFLTKFFHHAYPEGRVVTVGSEILFRREIDTTEFRGTMALTNYPLLPFLQDWTRVSEDTTPAGNGDPAPRLGHAHRVFPAKDSEGAYIAMRVLLNRTESFGQTASPMPAANSQAPAASEGAPLEVEKFEENIPEAADPFWLHHGKTWGGGESLRADENMRADTWLTVIGRDGYWPVAMLNEELTPSVVNTKPGVSNVDRLNSEKHPKDDLPSAPPSTLAEMSTGNARAYYLPGQSAWAPLSWRVFVVVVLILAFWHTAGCSNIRGLSSVYLFNAFRPRATPSHQILLGFSSASALALAFPLLAPWVYLAFTHPYLVGASVMEIVEAGLTALFYGGCIGFAIWILSRIHRGNAPGKYQYWALTSFAAAILVFASLNLAPAILDLNPANDVSHYYRSVHINNGVSPILPFLFLMVGLYMWSWQILAGDALLGPGKPLLPKHYSGKSKLRKQEWYEIKPSYLRISARMGKKIDHLARPWTLPTGVWLPAAVLVFLCLISFHRALPVLTFEGGAYSLLLNISLLIAVALMASEAARLLLTWRRLKRMLVALGRMPLGRTFCVMKEISISSLWSMSGNVPRTQYQFFDRQLRVAKRLQVILADGGKPAIWSLDEFIEVGKEFSRRYLRNLEYTAWWDQKVRRNGKPSVAIRRLIANCVADVINRVLQPQWYQELLKVEPPPVAAKDATAAKNSDADNAVSETLPVSEDAATRVGEEFVCLLYVSYMQNILARMRTMVFSMSAIYVSTMLALAFYPFAPRPSIASWMLGMLVVLGAVVGVVYAGMARDKILSYITNTKTALDADFWLKYAGFLVPPVLALMTAQFPEIADSVSSWVQPALDAVK